MNYGEIKTVDIANGIGVRVSLFVSGCRNNCKECFNPMTWDFHYGKTFQEEDVDLILKALNHEYIDGLTILGGEPFEPENQATVLYLIQKVKEKYPNKTIWIYSGFTFEQLVGDEESRAHTDVARDIMSMIDILVDGRFDIQKKNLSLKFRGSSNQRIIDVKETLKAKSIVLSDLN